MTARRPTTKRCNDCGAPTEAGYYSPPDAPMARAVRELLRDVVLLERSACPFEDALRLGGRAAKLLGTTPAAIVARARKVLK